MNQLSGNEVPIMELPNGVLRHVATILHEPSEILNLALTCQGLRVICEGVARAVIDGATDEERSNLPQVNLPTTRDLSSPDRSHSFRNWGLISKYQQIFKHREGLKFDQVVGGVKYSDPNDMSKIIFSEGSGFGASNRIMRSGVHRATFELSGNGMAWLGIVRPMDYKRIALYNNRCIAPEGQRVTGLRHRHRIDTPTDVPVLKKYPMAWGDEVNTNAVLLSYSGHKILYKGLERTCDRRNIRLCFDINDKIGLVLDLDTGTLSVSKNGSYVGELCSGLEGEYVWVGCISSGVNQFTSMGISDSE